MRQSLRLPLRVMVMTAVKKSNNCKSSITIEGSQDIDSLVACLATEDVNITETKTTTIIEISSNNLSDLRARINTVLRSLQAASEALIEVDRTA